MKQFKDLTRQEKLELIEAQLDGKTIEFWDGQSWLRTLSGETLFYYSDVRYRVPKTKDEFTNWDILPPEYKWVARDKSGQVYAYPKKPTIEDNTEGDGFWHGRGTPVRELPKVDKLTCYKRGTVDWTESLIERPEGD